MTMTKKIGWAFNVVIWLAVISLAMGIHTSTAGGVLEPAPTAAPVVDLTAATVPLVDIATCNIPGGFGCGGGLPNAATVDIGTAMHCELLD